ncbi:MAG: RNA-binding protein [Asticcacaulis sp.]
MSPNPQNEPALPVIESDEAGADDAPEIAVLCEDGSGKLRRDIASGQSQDTSGLLRFVVSPDGEVVPDIAQKLPGRGFWLACDRASLDIAVRKHIFAKVARRQVKVAPALSDQVHGLLRRRCLDLLGLARREGAIVNGFEKVLSSIKSGKCGWLIEASDGAEDGRKKLLAALSHQGGQAKLCGCFGNAELSLALGQENAIHAALVDGRRVQRWSFEMKRLSGFEPLIPPAWGAAEQT